MISLLHWCQISFPGAFFWDFQTVSSHWEPDLENRVGAEAIQSAIHIALSLLRSTCDTVHYLGERELFSSSFVAIFWWFLPSNSPIMLYNIRYWWFFLSQGNIWTKYLVHPKIWCPKPFLLMFVSLVTLDGFHLLLSTQLTADLTPEWSDRSMFYPLSHIYAKTPFCCIETVANNALNRRCIVVFDQLWANAAPTLNTAFSLTNVHAKWWIHYLMISPSPLLSHATSIYDWPKWVCGVLWCFLGQLPNLGAWAFSIICVCTTMFKVSIPPLNHCFQQSRVWITLIKPLLCMNSNFSPSESNALSTHEIQIFPLFWKFVN